MKLILLLALHGGAHASTRHKATKNAVDEATTQRLAAEAASASVIKMPGAVAKLFGREEGAEVPAKQAQGPVKQHQDRFKACQGRHLLPAPQPPLRQLWRWQWLLLPLLRLWAYRIGQEELGRRHLGVGADSSINKPITNSPVNTETPPYITIL